MDTAQWTITLNSVRMCQGQRIFMMVASIWFQCQFNGGCDGLRSPVLLSSCPYLVRMTPGLQFTHLVNNDFMNGHKIDSCFWPLSLLSQPRHNNLSHGYPTFDLGHPPVSGMNSPNACLIQASVRVHPLTGGYGIFHWEEKLVALIATPNLDKCIEDRQDRQKNALGYMLRA